MDRLRGEVLASTEPTGRRGPVIARDEVHTIVALCILASGDSKD